MNHRLDTDERVLFYENEFYVLSNFSAFRVAIWNEDFDTSEQAYHWAKFRNAPEIQAKIKYARSAHEAFEIAKHYKVCRRTDWAKVRLDIMTEILFAKVNQHEYVKRKLLETGLRELVEDSWRDSYWGWGPHKDGKNMLGNLWMQVRKVIVRTQFEDSTKGTT